MQLQYCTLTGADDTVDPVDLLALTNEFPFAEFAILLMPSEMGKPRFPTASWIKKFTDTMNGKHIGMHLCGPALLDFIDGDMSVLETMKGFDRIQVNVKFAGMAGKYDPQKLVTRIKASPQLQFIVQYGKAENTLLHLLKDVPNHAVLFDESAGRGVSPDSWQAPLSGHFCGYAGGLNPDNVKQNLEMIKKVAAGHETWIDMETGVRTNDVFDLTKVRRVLEIAKDYAAKASCDLQRKQEFGL